jgi:hypothetical protein
MNLLRFPDDILDHVASATSNDHLRLFSERTLRSSLALKSGAARHAAFCRLRVAAG